MDPVRIFDPTMEVAALSYACRLLFAQLDREVMLERAAESLADLGGSPEVAIFLNEPPAQGESSGKVKAVAALSERRFSSPQVVLDVAGGPAERVMADKRPHLYALEQRDGLPWPSAEPAGLGKCLCAPLVAANFEVTGIATLAYPHGGAPRAEEAQPLITYLAMLAVGLETAHLFTLAVTDGLTDLYVRRFFDIRLQEEVGRLERYGGELSLAMIDLDCFKELNDTNGHLEGDEVLKQVAALIRQEARRKVDVPCRFGGEEFVLIMPGTPAEGALRVAERIRAACAASRFQCSRGSHRVTLSAGVATIAEPLEGGAEELVRRADQALYQAKQAGRNRVRLWQPPEA